MPASGFGCSAATQPRKRYWSSSRLEAPPGSSRSPGFRSSPSGPRRWMPRGFGAFFGRAAPGRLPAFAPAAAAAAVRPRASRARPGARLGRPAWPRGRLRRALGLLGLLRRGPPPSSRAPWPLVLRDLLLDGHSAGGLLHRSRFQPLGSPAVVASTGLSEASLSPTSAFVWGIGGRPNRQYSTNGFRARIDDFRPLMSDQHFLEEFRQYLTMLHRRRALVLDVLCWSRCSRRASTTTRRGRSTRPPPRSSSSPRAPASLPGREAARATPWGRTSTRPSTSCCAAARCSSG